MNKDTLQAPMKRMTASPGPSKVALMAALALALGACATTTGMGGGELTRKGKADEPVLYSWQSTDGGISGTMVAALPDATYQGRFFQITEQTRRQVVSPLWGGWAEGWTDWPYWGWGTFGPYEWTQFRTRYTGKVLANLRTNAGRHMRCRFHLARPAQGMAGGGEGECQLERGGIAHARF